MILPKFYIYKVNIQDGLDPGVVVLGNGLTVSPTINFNSDTDFILSGIRQTAQDAGGVTINFRESAGNNFMNGAVDANLLGAGSPNDPWTFFPNPAMGIPSVIIPKNSKITVDITNNSGADLAFHEVWFLGYQIPCIPEGG
jgi:hypothetical protein